MAAPITHVVLSEKIFDKEFSNFIKKDFIVGTSFPDIRYLGTISREKTHLDIVPLDQLINLESFEAGMRFHSLVDKVREAFLVSRNIYSYCPKSKYLTQSVKFVEDTVLYTKISNWGVFKDYFDTLLPQEVNSDAGDTAISKWHNLLKVYLLEKPNEKTIKYFVKEINLPDSVAHEINAIVKNIEKIPQVISYIEDLFSNFEELLKNYPI